MNGERFPSTKVTQAHFMGVGILAKLALHLQWHWWLGTRQPPKKGIWCILHRYLPTSRNMGSRGLWLTQQNHRLKKRDSKIMIGKFFTILHRKIPLWMHQSPSETVLYWICLLMLLWCCQYDVEFSLYLNIFIIIAPIICYSKNHNTVVMVSFVPEFPPWMMWWRKIEILIINCVHLAKLMVLLLFYWISIVFYWVLWFLSQR